MILDPKLAGPLGLVIEIGLLKVCNTNASGEIIGKKSPMPKT
jgi:hypothetical protein